MRNVGEVRYSRSGSVAEIVFDRPETRNAMTWSMYDQLESACERLERDEGLRVAVLRGAGGRAFVSGTDIAQFREFSTGRDGVEYERTIERVVARLESVQLPTLAVIEGSAAGAGLVLAAVCDLRICTPDARFGVPIARTVGNCLSGRNHARLASLLGPSRTKGLLLLGNFMRADAAFACGFVHEVVKSDSLDARLYEIAEDLCNRAGSTIAATKESLRRITHANLPDMEDILRRCYESPDFSEGVQAFVEKRDPLWT